jgi:PTS system nitrogen regulatory IIA component
MIIGDLLDGGSISARVSASTKRQALAVIAEIAARSFGLKAAKVLEALMERESVAATGVGHGIAVPHAQIPGLTRMRGVFIRLETPIEFEAVDDEPVDLLFALLAPPGAGADHLRALAKVSRILRRAEVREQLRNARGVDGLLAVLAQEPQSSAA